MARSRITIPASLGEWLLAVLLAGNLVWTTLCLGGYRPETMVASWPLTGAAFALQLGLAAWFGSKPHPAGVWLLPFLAYAAFNVVAISPVSWLGWRDWLGWAQMIAVFWIVLNGVKRPGPRVLVLGTLAVLGVISVLFAAYQRFVWPDWLMMGRVQAQQFIGRASGPFGIPNSLAAFLLLLIPPALALAWQRGATAAQRVLWIYLAAVFLLGLGLTISRGAWLSLIVVLVLWPLCARGLTLPMRVTLAATACAAALLTGLVLYSAVPRVQQRIDALVADVGERSRPVLWNASWELFKDAPVLGTGAGSYNILFERYRPEGFLDEPQWAHNDYLNTLSDYGAIGFLLFFGALGFIAYRTTQQRSAGPVLAEATIGWAAPDLTRALGVGLAAFALSLVVDFHFKIPALAMTSAVIAAELVRRTWPEHQSRPVQRSTQFILLGSSLAVALLTLGVALPLYRAEAERYAGRQMIDRLAQLPQSNSNARRTTLTDASVAFARAVELHPGNAQAWSDQAYAQSLWSHLAPLRMNALGRDAEVSSSRALTLSDKVPEFWIRRGVALDMQGRWAEAGTAFVHALELAPTNANVWYYHAYHLSLREISRALATSAIETCLRLDPQNASALALRQRLTSP